MPLLIAPLVALSVGLLLGLRSPGALGARGAAVARTCVAWLAALAFFPALAVISLSEPAWATLHVLGEAEVPSFILLLASALVSSLVLVGYRAARSLATSPRDGGPRVGALTAAIPAAFALVLLAALRDRVGLLEPAHGRTPEVALVSSRFALALLTLDGLLGVATWLTSRALDDLAQATPRNAGRLGRPRRPSATPARESPP
ncbi:MAG: hypothetical protein IPM79_03195 [Polyangiaceae bacterium]|nr:hypothetical protein [Polyangiaceae bacterium]MBK8936669.1 hypothetical protein [Polyangiaceae bacterium]